MFLLGHVAQAHQPETQNQNQNYGRIQWTS